MSNVLEVACYEIEKYVLEFKLKGMSFSAEREFEQEEQVLQFLEEKEDAITEYKMTKAMHAVIQRKPENETPKDKFYRELVKIGGELYAKEIMDYYTDREIEEEGEEILKGCWEDYRDYERDKADGRE